MQDIQLHRATTADVDILVDMRILFGNELVGEQDEDTERQTRMALLEYFMEELNRSCICRYAMVDGEVASTACVVLRRQPPSLKNQSGRWGYFMNVYTVPEYRRRGLSAMVLQQLEKDAAEMGVTAFELHATEAGAPVYEAIGYKIHAEPTYRKFI